MCATPGLRRRRSSTAADESKRRNKAGREPPLAESFHLLVKCTNEAEQRDLYERLTAEGRSCRVLSL